jgi:Ca2+/Na+ antiporter
MELDDLKNIWNDKGIEAPGADKISAMIGRQSQNPIAKMKRNLRMELLILIFSLGIVAAYYFIAFKREYSIIGWVYTLLLVLFCYYFFRKNKLLNEMQCSSCHVKSNLELQLRMLGRYVRFYLISGTAILPILFIFLGIVLYYKKPTLISETILYPSATNPVWKFLLAWFILLSVSTTIMWVLNRGYVNKLYGRHINKLKQLLAQINE